ncbi:UPF0598 protein [Biomphalaria pfeifferi]|uniref:UPF0598 protein n=1 Tax=Biomphalaria pfeifferi TaxID=112525 RepID=A0AAD8EXV0_BIOPF|nr:UPF0598 protein [Biomphalaria pfeifferi]
MFGGYVEKRFLNYVQGQSPDDDLKTREYFYYVDHQGQLFLDDSKMKNFTSCFKEKDFLVFFFKRFKLNTTGKYMDEFPYVSPCGRELNFVRCDDVPIVFTHILESSSHFPGILSYNGAGHNLTVKLEPENICMSPLTGRVYHPAPKQYGSIGLIKSSLALELSKYFEFHSSDQSTPPSHFNWRGVRYELTNVLLDVVKTRQPQVV